MKTKQSLRGKVTIGTAIALTAFTLVSLSIALPGKPSKAGAGSDESPRHAAYADCLWPLARNHGFFELQRQALDTTGSTTARALWLEFIASTGAEVCANGSSDIVADLGSLERALSATQEAAERHFAASDR